MAIPRTAFQLVMGLLIVIVPLALLAPSRFAFAQGVEGGGGGGGAPPPSIGRFLAEYQQRYNRHDPASVVDFYAADARWMAAAGPVLQGREQIEPMLAQFMAVVPPTLSLDERARVTAGEHAASLGTYLLSGEVAGEARAIGGAYLNLLRTEGGAWRVAGQQMNYAVQLPPESWVGRIEGVVALPETGVLGELAASVEAGVAAGDHAGLARLLTDGSLVALPATPLRPGRAALADALTALSRTPDAAPPRLDVHELNTLELDDGVAADVGWWELFRGGERVRWGSYTLLARRDPAGGWRIEWLVATGSPGIPGLQ